MTMTTLIQHLESKGFSQYPSGGGCMAMVRYRDGKSDVITSTDGGSLPEADDWLFCIYSGDWRKEDCGDEVDNLCSDMSPLHLLELC